jgi:hypothetical protein
MIAAGWAHCPQFQSLIDLSRHPAHVDPHCTQPQRPLIIWYVDEDPQTGQFAAVGWSTSGSGIEPGWAWSGWQVGRSRTYMDRTTEVEIQP